MKKGGPATSSGKAVSSRNATRHGLLAMMPVVPGLEQEGDWEAHRAGIFQSFSPEGHLEEVLADRVALQLWRLHRVARYEATTIGTAQQKALDDIAWRRHQLEASKSSPWQQLKDARAKLDESRNLLRRIRDLPDLADDAPLTGPEAVEIVEKAESITLEATADTISVPFLHDGEDIDYRTKWTAAELREFLAILAAADGQEPHQLLEKALAYPQQQIDQLEQKLAELTAQVEQDRIETSAQVERVRGERLIPSERELEKVSRYEAHLSRELYKAMHQLEALQERRHGRPAPLARLDVTGLPAG